MSKKKKLPKREFIKKSAGLAAAGLGFPFVHSCKQSEVESDLEFLNWSSWTVDPHPNREASVKSINFIQNAKGEINDSKLNILASKAAALPDAYLKYLESAHSSGFFVEVNRFGQGWAGLCQLGDPPGFVKVEIGSVNSGHVFNHECGHALMYASFKGVGGQQNSEDLLSKVYSNAKGSAEGSAAWDYAMKNYREYWACGVSSFYASQACRDDLRKNYSIAWEYFNAALAPPPEDKPFGSASGISQQPGVPTDPNAPYDPNSTRPQFTPGVTPGFSVPPNANTGTAEVAQLQQTLQQFMAFQMQRQYQQMQYQQMQMQRRGLGLAQSKEAKMDNVHDGMEVNENMNIYLEIIPGYKDLTDLSNYNIYLKAPNSKKHIELPSNFHLDVSFIQAGHAWSKATVPSHQKIAELVDNKFEIDKNRIPGTDLELLITDKNRNVIDFKKIRYVKDHADGGKELAALGNPRSFARIHSNKYDK